LKPENILLDASKTVVKLTDFGMANLSNKRDAMLETACGSPHYAAPEVIQCQKYKGSGSDVWSLGVLLFALAAGRLPFNDRSVAGVMDKVTAGKYTMPSQFDPNLQDLIHGMLQVDTRKRFTTEKIKQHPFWLENCNAQGLNPNGVSCSPPEVGKELRKSDSSQRISDPNATNCPDKGELSGVPMRQLRKHPLLHCDPSSFKDEELNEKFEELQKVIRAIAACLEGSSQPKPVAPMDPSELQSPIEEPYHWDAISYIASQQGLTNAAALLPVLQDAKPNTEKAFYRLLVQQKAARGNLDHLANLCPVNVPQAADDATEPGGPPRLYMTDTALLKSSTKKKTGFKGMFNKVFGGGSKKDKEKESETEQRPSRSSVSSDRPSSSKMSHSTERAAMSRPE
jgi:serine/threonine protein kinase